jgi:Thaumarchaeal output domain 1
MHTKDPPPKSSSLSLPRGAASVETARVAPTHVAAATAAPDDRRSESRYVVCRTVVAVPLLPDGRLDWAQRIDGVSVDLSADGIGFELATDRGLAAGRLAIGVEDRSGKMQCEGIEICRAEQVSPSRMRVGARFGGPAHELLRPENLIPTLDPQTMQFTTRFSPETLRNWVELGLLRPVVMDRVQLCPKCRSLPTFRQGCRACGSGRVVSERLIHHFACAHVAPVRDFETDGGLVCPKCRTRHLIVGADYEYSNGPYHCLACQWTDTELEQVAHCLRCGFRFPGHQALEQELVGYDANRLDVLALLAAP